MSIPKVIHYCWFGNNPKSEIMIKCMDSWKKFAPDYEIIEWNEQNFNIKKYAYTQEAYESGKYAFVSDVVRFDILFLYGGIYLDTDVELIKPIDVFLEDSFFLGYDREGLLSSGLIAGAQKGNSYIEKILQYYSDTHFFLPNGRPNTTTVCTIVTDLLKQYGIQPDGKILRSDAICLYPATYFDPFDFESKEIYMTEETCSIHHYAGTWKSKKDITIMNIGLRLKKIVGKDRYEKIAKLKHRILG